MNSKIVKQSFYEDIRRILSEARQKAHSSVHFAMVEAYWMIGRRIVEEEQAGKDRAEYGTFLIKELSIKLAGDFGRRFSIANLKNFRQFYLVFPDFQKSYTVCSRLSWSHLRLIMRIDKSSARDYYINQAADENWSVQQLERNINTHYYERLLSSKNKKRTKKSEKLTHQDIGQMDMYVRMFDELKRTETDNPTIGIILCAEKYNTIVKYSV